jgi:hypothetical protein
MSTDQTDSHTLVKEENQLVTVAMAVSFMVVVWMAAHVSTHSEESRGIYLYVESYVTNFVDPTVKAFVVKTGDEEFLYSYAVSNGPWGFQEIRQVAVESGQARVANVAQTWSHSTISTQIGHPAVLWEVVSTKNPDAGIPRGDRPMRFTLQSSIPPTIVQAHAGNDLHHDDWRSLVTDVSTPAGGRVARWTLGPRRTPRPETIHGMLGELVPGVHKAAELGWIDRDLAGAIGRSLIASATAAKAGETETAIARLERLVEVVVANAGLQVNEEGYALIAYNVEFALGELRSTIRHAGM